MKRYLLLIFIVICPPSYAQLGDGPIIAQLVEQVNLMNQQIQKAKDQLNIAKRLHEMEQLKSVKKLMGEGKAMQELLRETDELKRNIKNFKNDPFGTHELDNEISSLKKAISNTKNNPHSQRAYSSLLARLTNLRFLGKAQEASRDRMSGGANEEDNQNIAATSSMIMSDILLQNEIRAKKERGADLDIANSIMNTTGYKGLFEE